MIVFLLALALAAALTYIANLLGQLHKVQNKFGLRIAGLEQELHEALEAVGHYHSPVASPYMEAVAVADPNSASGIALAAMIARQEQQIIDAMAVPPHMLGNREPTSTAAAMAAAGNRFVAGEHIVMPSVSYDPGEGGEHASCIVIADPSEHSGRLILDDPYPNTPNVELVHDDELTERLRSSIARRAGEDTPIIHIIAKVHEEDVILDGELDLSYLIYLDPCTDCPSYNWGEGYDEDKEATLRL